MAYKILLGPSAWDAVNYVRNAIEDTDPTAPVIPDSAFKTLVEVVIEEFSGWVPITKQVGDVYASTSPLVTVTGQQRYICNQANGFVDGLGAYLPPAQILDVLYRASGAYSAANELTYLTILPFSPITTWLMDPELLTQPSMRYQRDAVFNELDHYGKGFAGIITDPSGYYAIDLYPVPVTAGLPIFVRYAATYPLTADAQQNGILATVPDHRKRHFADLLLARIKEQEAERFAKNGKVKIGILQENIDPEPIMRQARELRERVHQELGSAGSVAEVAS